MPTIAEISTTPDVVTLILEHTHVTDGLRFARVSTVWRDASHAVCGIACMSGPRKVVAHDGIYVVESLARRVSVFDCDGNFQRVILCNGERFADPVAVAFAGGRMVVCDYVRDSHSQLKVLTMDGVLLQVVDLGRVLDVSLSVDISKGCLYASSNFLLNAGTFDQREWAEARLQIIPVWRANPTARKRQQYAQLLLELEKTKNELRAVRQGALERFKRKNRHVSLAIQAVQEHMTLGRVTRRTREELEHHAGRRWTGDVLNFRRKLFR